VENVIPYYTPLISPRFKIGRHFFWSNFYVPSINIQRSFSMENETLQKYQDAYGIDLSNFRAVDKIQLFRNCTEPLIGEFILKNALTKIKGLYD
jgi:DNA (cytosine-5)-methyltransferase 1